MSSMQNSSYLRERGFQVIFACNTSVYQLIPSNRMLPEVERQNQTKWTEPRVRTCGNHPILAQSSTGLPGGFHTATRWPSLLLQWPFPSFWWAEAYFLPDEASTCLSNCKSFIIQFSFLYETIEWRTRNRVKVTTHDDGTEAAVFPMGHTGNLCEQHCQLSQLNITSPWVIQQMSVSYTDGGRGSTWHLGLQE